MENDFEEFSRLAQDSGLSIRRKNNILCKMKEDQGRIKEKDGQNRKYRHRIREHFNITSVSKRAT